MSFTDYLQQGCQQMSTVMRRLGADAIVATHWMVVLFVLFGGFLTIGSRVWAWVHIPIAAWAAYANIADRTCPLTTWEKTRRHELGESYDGGFVQQHVAPLVRVQGARRRLEVFLGVAVVVWNTVMYIALYVYRND